MGYWPAKLTTLLNIILMVGYATLTCIIAGQILSAVSDGSMTVIVGIVIAALMAWVVAVFGMKIFHTYERYVYLQNGHYHFTWVRLIKCSEDMRGYRK